MHDDTMSKMKGNFLTKKDKVVVKVILDDEEEILINTAPSIQKQQLRTSRLNTDASQKTLNTYRSKLSLHNSNNKEDPNAKITKKSTFGNSVIGNQKLVQ
jgi:hypothetical protein